LEKLLEGLPSKALASKLIVEFSLFYLHCRSLEFKQAPDYGYLRRLLRDLIYKESFEHEIAFEWLVKG